MMISTPPVLGLFQKRIDGDNALLELANLRFMETGLKTEVYGDSVDTLNEVLKFRPEPFGFSILHLPRGKDIFNPEHRRQILDLIKALHTSFSGFVLHDQPGIEEKIDKYANTVGSIADFMPADVMLFVEYAAGLAPESYLDMLAGFKRLKNVSGCIDIGHVALREVNCLYSKSHPGEKISALRKREDGAEYFMPDIERALSCALPAVLKIIRGAGALKKHIHFHLHDGHPLSTISRYGLSDHLGFFEKIPLPYEYKNRRYLNPMFGPDGLNKIVKAAMEFIGAKNLSFTIEVHPTEKRTELGNAGHLFSHWKNLVNAERMNYWLWDLARMQGLVSRSIAEFKDL